MDDEGLRKQIEFQVTAEHGLCAPSLLDAIMALIKQDRENRKDVVNRFEVIKFLPDGKTSEIAIGEDQPFNVTYNLQDDGRTLKVFLQDIAPTNSEVKQ